MVLMSLQEDGSVPGFGSKKVAATNCPLQTFGLVTDWFGHGSSGDVPGPPGPSPPPVVVGTQPVIVIFVIPMALIQAMGKLTVMVAPPLAFVLLVVLPTVNVAAFAGLFAL